MADQRDAIERLFLRHVRGVGSFVCARVGDPELAEELTSRVFLQVVRKFHQMRGSPAGWLWSIVRTEIARHFRDERDGLPLRDEHAAPGEPPLDGLERTSLQVGLREALAKLPDETQQIVCMKFFLDLPHADIAAATGLSVSNVGVRVFRALRELRSLLQSCPEARAWSNPSEEIVDERTR